ncbi:hypothetical protein CFOL_v3_32083 [Cephalotus follicularis]|uniref:CCHC-type domain-containing protein n=1 Tax=Cephalotus follicularis TaxID=3775 RepID=A0A1Q3D898_CEPFO|nr:hypothetical protein CFOL_v3_32083 [Cephalotus follicularis]
MTKVLTREDANKPYWKENFITGLPTLFVEKIKSKYREKLKGVVPYETLTYGDIVSTITKTGLEICNDIKMKNKNIIKKSSKKRTQFKKNFKKSTNDFQKTNIQNSNTCYKCCKAGHIARYYKIRKQIKNLDLSEDHTNQLFKIIDNQNPEEEESDYFSTSSTKIQAIKQSTLECEPNSDNSNIKTCNCNNCIIGTTCSTDKH